jgi:flagellar biogenesis protein FliO
MDTMIWSIMKMVLVLGLMGGFLVWFVRKWRPNGLAKQDLLPDSGIRLLSTQPIAPQKYISLVEIGGEVLALGITQDHITLLGKIENKEFVGKVVSNGGARQEPFSWINYLQGWPLRPKKQGRGLLRRIHGR